MFFITSIDERNLRLIAVSKKWSIGWSGGTGICEIVRRLIGGRIFPLEIKDVWGCLEVNNDDEKEESGHLESREWDEISWKEEFLITSFSSVFFFLCTQMKIFNSQQRYRFKQSLN